MFTSGLPVDAILPEIIRNLTDHSSLLLSAEPGAGKSTVVPLALLKAGLAGANKKILMLEPRVLAARAAARRMAHLLGEKPGETVGYRTRHETVVSPRTRIEVLTEAILTRMLQNDPSLEDTAIVIFDEFHERSIHADLALTLTLNGRALFETDLKILIMSATLDAAPLQKLLVDAPVLNSEGRCFPVDVVYSAEHSQQPLELQICNAVRNAVQSYPGDVLVFLPGEYEIQKALSVLNHALLPGMEVLPLYGNLSVEEQDRVFQPHAPEVRRVILATSIAETSITIPSVRIVIDSGWMRIPRFSPANGMNRLETVRVTLASAEQRRGRAGRTSEGVCIRLWREYEQNSFPAFTRPEILSCDLAPAVLELVKWGRTSGNIKELPWVDTPPDAMISNAFSLLQSLDAIKDDRLTPHGEEMRLFPLHPRLAHGVLTGAANGYGELAAQLAAVLEDHSGNSSHTGTVDIVPRLRSLSPLAKQTVKRICSRLRDDRTGDYLRYPEGFLLAASYPDRIARRKDMQSGEYTLSNGVTAYLPKGDPLLRESEFLAVAETSTLNGRTTIRAAAALSIEELELLLPHLFEQKLDIRWDAERSAVLTEEVRLLGSLTLQRKQKSTDCSDPEVQSVFLKALRNAGFRVFEESKGTEMFRNRVTFLNRCGVEGYPDYSDAALLEILELWLSPYLGNISSFNGLRKLDLRSILENDLPPQARFRLNELAPEKLEVPSGSHIRIDYSDVNQPAASVRLQELFGMTSTPLLAGKVPLLLDILSPAMRTVQKTRDLISFWNESYFLVRKDMRGRYPKHDWPEDPWNAVAHRGVKRKS